MAVDTLLRYIVFKSKFCLHYKSSWTYSREKIDLKVDWSFEIRWVNNICGTTRMRSIVNFHGSGFRKNAKYYGLVKQNN